MFGVTCVLVFILGVGVENDSAACSTMQAHSSDSRGTTASKAPSVATGHGAFQVKTPYCRPMHQGYSIPCTYSPTRPDSFVCSVSVSAACSPCAHHRRGDSAGLGPGLLINSHTSHTHGASSAESSISLTSVKGLKDQVERPAILDVCH